MIFLIVCGMLVMWDVQDVICSVCGMYSIWDVRDVGCLLGYGKLVYKMHFRKTDFSISFAVPLKAFQFANLFQQILKETWQGHRMKVTH